MFPEIKRAKFMRIGIPIGSVERNELTNIVFPDWEVKEERLCRAAWARALAGALMCGWVRGISGNPRGCSLGCACDNCKAYAELLLQAEQDEKEGK